eukprot:3049579-Pyramimonas_sp.AAC.1
MWRAMEYNAVTRPSSKAMAIFAAPQLMQSAAHEEARAIRASAWAAPTLLIKKGRKEELVGYVPKVLVVNFEYRAR